MTETGERPARAGPWWWQRRRSAVLDAALGLISAGECVFQGVAFASRTGVPVFLMVVFGALAGGTLVLRSRWPLAVVLVALAVAPAQMGVLLGLVGLYTLAASDAPRRIIALLSGLHLAGGFLVMQIQLHQGVGADPDFNPPTWFIPLVSFLMSAGYTGPPVFLGLYVGARRRLVESLRERADGLERELSLLADRAEERAEWARNEERTRIAREMHDVVAHRVSLMVVHASALQVTAAKDPEKAARNAGLVGDMGRQALTELRTMLGVLRSGEGAAEAGAASRGPAAVVAAAPLAPGGHSPVAESAAASREPEWRDGVGVEAAPRRIGLGVLTGRARQQAAETAGSAGSAGPAGSTGAEPREADAARATAGGDAEPERPQGATPPGGGAGEAGIAELEALVGQSRAAGMTVEFSTQGAARDYEAAIEPTVYRIVQEALTNVHKHAPGARTRVRLAHRPEELALQVENEPPESGEGVADAGLPSGGNGLVGMRERVEAVGGTLVSGPTEAGGFRVSALIPVAPPREPEGSRDGPRV
ncbi:sensor histidine kinase [Streptomyces sp. AJS327]|uniref:sensor histidine kinase n=1 Tax=Streptomyces sp. AJS327 TaxID=2545265 RepID=UPI0015DD6386|nr:sensor histidine kinase [Streptomyces sp. AJS327]MBA0049396.1 sensor histidine kinase [Streptomyces sp. AJS327]